MLLTAVALVYCSLGRNEFVHFDDDSYVYGNDQVKEGFSWQSIVWAFTTTHAANWHPLTWLSHMLDWQLFGNWPGGHHLISGLIHGLNVLLLYVVLAGMTRRPWPSAVVAALFAVHPLHVESVAWASERKDVLSTFFALLSLWAYGRYVRKPGHKFYIASLGFFALGLMAKPMVVTLPLLMLLLDYWPLERFSLGRFSFDAAVVTRLLLEKLPFFLLTGLSCAMTYYAQSTGGAVMPLAALRPIDRFLNSQIGYVVYIEKMIFPRGLAPFYPLPAHVSWPQGIAAAAALVALTLFFVVLGRRRRYLLVGWLWYLLMLVPVIGLVQVGQQAVADRYTYMPLIGLFILVVWTLCGEGQRGHLSFVPSTLRAVPANERCPRCLSRQATHAVLVVAVAFVLAVCTALANQQVDRWSTRFGLFAHTFAVTTDNVVALNNLGLALKDSDPKSARAFYKAAIALNFTNPEAHGNLGNLLTEAGEYDAAIEQYGIVLKLNKRDSKAYERLAEVWKRQGNWARAEQMWRENVKLEPQKAEFHDALAETIQAQGRTEEALAEYAIALKLRPRFSPALNNVAWIRAVHPMAQYRDGQEAVKLALRARSNGDNDSNLLDTLAAAYAECGKFDEARATAQEAVETGTREKIGSLEEMKQRAALYAQGKPFRDLQLLGPKR
jgi:tetratricopeptide (TPR) repeat protein/uncharacterized membrane protein YhaH (DUF805 family)